MNEVHYSSGHTNSLILEVLEQKKYMEAFSRKFEGRRDSMSYSLTSSVTSSSAHKKIKHLSKCDVPEFIIKSNLIDENQLMTIAKERHDAGWKDLYRFCGENGEKELSFLLIKTWRIHTAADVLRQVNTPRIEKVKKLLSAKCVDQ